MSTNKIPCEICVGEFFIIIIYIFIYYLFLDASEIRTYQTFQVAAKLQMRTISNLEDLQLGGEQICAVKEACAKAPGRKTFSFNYRADGLDLYKIDYEGNLISETKIVKNIY